MLDNISKNVKDILAAGAAVLSVLSTTVETSDAATPPAGLEEQQSRRSLREEFDREIVKSREAAQRLLDRRKETLELIRQIISTSERTIEAVKRIKEKTRSDEMRVRYDKIIEDYASKLQVLKSSAEKIAKDNDEFEAFIRDMK